MGCCIWHDFGCDQLDSKSPFLVISCVSRKLNHAIEAYSLHLLLALDPSSEPEKPYRKACLVAATQGRCVFCLACMPKMIHYSFLHHVCEQCRHLLAGVIREVDVWAYIVKVDELARNCTLVVAAPPYMFVEEEVRAYAQRVLLPEKALVPRIKAIIDILQSNYIEIGKDWIPFNGKLQRPPKLWIVETKSKLEARLQWAYELLWMCESVSE